MVTYYVFEILNNKYSKSLTFEVTAAYENKYICKTGWERSIFYFGNGNGTISIHKYFIIVKLSVYIYIYIQNMFIVKWPFCSISKQTTQTSQSSYVTDIVFQNLYHNTLFFSHWPFKLSLITFFLLFKFI